MQTTRLIQGTYSVDYDHVETEPIEGASRRRRREVADLKCRATVEVTIDLATIVQKLGAQAARNRSRKSRQGCVTVKCVGKPEVLKRTPRPEPAELPPGATVKF